MDAKAMYKLSYGLFVVTANRNGKDNGCITNTAQQVTTDPNQISLAVNKNNYTHDMIVDTGKLTVSVISEDADFELFKHFAHFFRKHLTFQPERVRFLGKITEHFPAPVLNGDFIHFVSGIVGNTGCGIADGFHSSDPERFKSVAHIFLIRHGNLLLRILLSDLLGLDILSPSFR